MKVRFEPQNITVEADSDKCILQIAQENKVHIRSVCKGLPSCGECRVYLLEGDDNVLPPTKAELNVLGTNHFVDHRRLSCQLRCFGDVVVDVSEHVGRADSTVKKIRGAKKGSDVGRSSAVVDTLLLKDGSVKEDIMDKDSNDIESSGKDIGIKENMNRDVGSKVANPRDQKSRDQNNRDSNNKQANNRQANNRQNTNNRQATNKPPNPPRNSR